MTKKLIIFSIGTFFLCNSVAFSKPRAAIRASGLVYKVFYSNLWKSPTRRVLDRTLTVPSARYYGMNENSLGALRCFSGSCKVSEQTLGKFKLFNKDFSDRSPIENIIRRGQVSVADVFDSIITLKNDPQAKILDINTENLDDFIMRVEGENIEKESLIQISVYAKDKEKSVFLWIHNLSDGRFMITSGNAKQKYLTSADSLKRFLESINDTFFSVPDEIHHSNALKSLLDVDDLDHIYALEFITGLEMPCSDCN